MLEAKKRGNYIDDQEEKRKALLEGKKKQQSLSKPPYTKDDQRIAGENNLDPELRKINDKGRRVGWSYRYRIRRKLDHLKRQQIGKLYDSIL